MKLLYSLIFSLFVANSLNSAILYNIGDIFVFVRTAYPASTNYYKFVGTITNYPAPSTFLTSTMPDGYSISFNFTYSPTSGNLVSDNIYRAISSYPNLVAVPYILPTCQLPQVLDPNTYSCVIPIPTCDPIDGMTAISGISQSMCVGSLQDINIEDGTGTNYVELVWQACDSTCYGVVQSFMSCSELQSSFIPDCTGNTHPVFDCTEAGGIGIVNTQLTKCTDDINPCDTKFDAVTANCQQENYRVVGYPECTHNGMIVTNDTIKCVLDIDANLASQRLKCSERWFEDFNEATQTCDCWNDYERNEFGICSKPLDVNATAAQKEADKIKNSENAQKKAKEQLDINSTSSAQTANVNQSDTLAGIRRDINQSNSLLQKILDKNNSVDAEHETTESDLDFLKNAIDGILKKYSLDFSPGECGSIEPIYIYFHGSQIVFFSQDTVNLLPVGAMRAVIIFMFTIAALIIVFRSN